MSVSAVITSPDSALRSLSVLWSKIKRAACLLAFKSPFLANVINLSAYGLSAFALAIVVSISLCINKDDAKDLNIARLWSAANPK